MSDSSDDSAQYFRNTALVAAPNQVAVHRLPIDGDWNEGHHTGARHRAANGFCTTDSTACSVVGRGTCVYIRAEQDLLCWAASVDARV
jgi:hypothetical protein